jgi:hypothetical protein
MPCTTILVGKKASYDGSTIIARNDDSGSGHYTSKKFAVIHPEDQPRKYRSVLSHVEIELPDLYLMVFVLQMLSFFPNIPSHFFWYGNPEFYNMRLPLQNIFHQYAATLPEHCPLMQVFLPTQPFWLNSRFQ